MNRRMLAAHPFQDGNGRSIRLLGDLVFQRYGLPPPLYPNERDLEMADAEAVQFILRGMRDYITEHTGVARTATPPPSIGKSSIKLRIKKPAQMTPSGFS
jgi:hypothetical protein